MPDTLEVGWGVGTPPPPSNASLAAGTGFPSAAHKPRQRRSAEEERRWMARPVDGGGRRPRAVPPTVSGRAVGHRPRTSTGPLLRPSTPLCVLHRHPPPLPSEGTVLRGPRTQSHTDTPRTHCLTDRPTHTHTHACKAEDSAAERSCGVCMCLARPQMEKKIARTHACTYPRTRPRPRARAQTHPPTHPLTHARTHAHTHDERHKTEHNSMARVHPSSAKTSTTKLFDAIQRQQAPFCDQSESCARACTHTHCVR